MKSENENEVEKKGIGDELLDEAARRGHKNATKRSAAGAAIGAVIGSFGGPMGAAVGAAVGAPWDIITGKKKITRIKSKKMNRGKIRARKNSVIQNY